MHKRKSLITTATSLLIALLMAIAAAGCATAPELKNATKPVANTYRIGPGDALRIFVRDNPDLSISVPVRPDGKISMPLIETMQAAGKTPTELSDDLQSALSAYVRDPRVTVIVTSFVGIYSDQVRVLGEAARPQSMPYRSGMTLLDVLINVGGLTQFAAGNRARLVRDVDGKQETYSVKLQDLLAGDIDDNVVVHPGDVIIIPRTYF